MRATRSPLQVEARVALRFSRGGRIHRPFYRCAPAAATFPSPSPAQPSCGRRVPCRPEAGSKLNICMTAVLGSLSPGWWRLTRTSPATRGPSNTWGGTTPSRRRVRINAMPLLSIYARGGSQHTPPLPASPAHAVATRVR